MPRCLCGGADVQRVAERPCAMATSSLDHHIIIMMSVPPDAPLIHLLIRMLPPPSTPDHHTSSSYTPEGHV
eukprot:4425711-Pyramimonas_sp.AAC.1